MAMANIFEQMSRSVSGMSKNASEVSNLRKKIAYERERIQEVMQEIGELYYESQEKELTKLKELCADIDDRKRRIQSMRLELQQMKGKRVCPGCGMQFDEKYQFAFCGKCGAKCCKARYLAFATIFVLKHKFQCLWQVEYLKKP